MEPIDTPPENSQSPSTNMLPSAAFELVVVTEMARAIDAVLCKNRAGLLEYQSTIDNIAEYLGSASALVIASELKGVCNAGGVNEKISDIFIDAGISMSEFYTKQSLFLEEGFKEPRPSASVSELHPRSAGAALLDCIENTAVLCAIQAAEAKQPAQWLSILARCIENGVGTTSKIESVETLSEQLKLANWTIRGDKPGYLNILVYLSDEVLYVTDDIAGYATVQKIHPDDEIELIVGATPGSVEAKIISRSPKHLDDAAVFEMYTTITIRLVDRVPTAVHLTPGTPIALSSIVSDRVNETIAGNEAIALGLLTARA